MASKDKLTGSFGSLSDTLAFRFDPSLPPDVAGRWLAVMAHTTATAHRSAEWIALPADSPGYDPVINDLDSATHAIVIANSPAKKLAALDEADRALDRVDALLSAPPLAQA